MKSEQITEYNFETIALRDLFIDLTFPERTCLEEPGFYKVKNGFLSVFLKKVTFIPNSNSEKELR